MPNFKAIGQSVWEKNGNRQTDRKDRNTDRLEFYFYTTVKPLKTATLKVAVRWPLVALSFPK